MYRSDRMESSFLSQHDLKKFLSEEGAINNSLADNLTVSFALGSHEGFVRLARCLFRPYRAACRRHWRLVRAARRTESLHGDRARSSPLHLPARPPSRSAHPVRCAHAARQ